MSMNEGFRGNYKNKDNHLSFITKIIIMTIKVGEVAPKFSLYSTEKKSVSLSDFQGKKKLVLFFPLAFTGVCTEELCTMRDQLTEYNNLDAQVLAISVDSLFTLDKYKEENNLNFPLLSDFNKEVSRMYDCIHETFAFDMQGVSKRSAFVIDADDVIRYAEVLDDPTSLPSFESIKEALSSC